MRQHYQKTGWAPMSGGDGSARIIITALDKPAFAVSARLAALTLKGYQQGFIHLERLS
ncbi:hypothetical protein [Pseudomonas sp. PB3P13]